ARRKRSRYGRSPFRTVSGTPTSGSILHVSSSSYSVQLFISFHVLRLRNLPSRVFQKAPEPGKANLSPYAGLQFFGQVDIDDHSSVMTVSLKDINGATVFSQELEPFTNGRGRQRSG